MALKDITTIEETEQLSADATFYTADGGAFRRAGMDAVKDALGLALESTATKQALLNCFQHVAWIDENGQEYYDALYDALYNIPVSISATFVQGSNVIYNTDPLSVLRQYLVVRATYEDETVQTVTAYTLSGNLTVGTSTITAAYKGKTATFDVTVTQAQSRITAVYTQSGTVYVDEGLDALKDDLVVTYYANESAEGVIVPASDYILSGTLTAGTSTVMVNYLGNTTTFTVTGVIDYYDIWSWSTDSNLILYGGGSGNFLSDGVNVPAYYAINGTRASAWAERGLSEVKAVPGETTATPGEELYPIPVPDGATTATFTVTPNTYYGSIRQWVYNNGWSMGSQTGWQLGTGTLTLAEATGRYLTINVKFNSGGTSGSLPTNISVTFA